MIPTNEVGYFECRIVALLKAIQAMLDTPEVISSNNQSRTGTLTRAMPVKSGEPCTSRQWSRVDHRGSFRNTTVNGQITGFGLDLGGIDDAIIMRFDVRRECARVTAFCAIWRCLSHA